MDTDTGEELPIRPGADGWLEVGIGEKPEGSIVIDYYGTTVQHVSPYISLATVLALSAAAVIRRKNSRKYQTV